MNNLYLQQQQSQHLYQPTQQFSTSNYLDTANLPTPSSTSESSQSTANSSSNSATTSPNSTKSSSKQAAANSTSLATAMANESQLKHDKQAIMKYVLRF